MSPQHFTLLFSLLVVLIVVPSFTVANRWRDGAEAAREMSAAEEYADEEPFNVQRRELCARWGDSCVPDAKVKFARCCSGMKCDCGSALLGNGKCLCKKESLFGRR